MAGGRALCSDRGRARPSWARWPSAGHGCAALPEHSVSWIRRSTAAENVTHEVRIALTGYGPWTGVCYPLKQGQKIAGTKAKFGEFAYYAERFDTVEINNTPTARRR